MRSGGNGFFLSAGLSLPSGGACWRWAASISHRQGQLAVDLPWQSRAGKLLVPGEMSHVSALMVFVSFN